MAPNMRALMCVALMHCVGCYEHHLRDSVDGNIDLDANMSVTDTGLPLVDAGTDAELDAQPDANDGGHTEAGTDARVTHDCYVPENYPTIQAALDDSTCDPIIVTEHQWVSTVRIERDVTITTLDDNTHPAVIGDGNGSVFTVTAATTVVLERLRITGGHAVVGGGIDSAGHLTLRDVTVSDNGAGSGGGLNQAGGSVHFTGAVVFESNRAAGEPGLAYGGAMQLIDSENTFDGSLVIRRNDCECENGFASGGGIWLVGGSLRGGPGLLMENNVATARCTRLDGLAWAHGGAIATSGAEVDLESPTFTGNSAHASGTGPGCRPMASGGAVNGAITIHGGLASNNGALAEVDDVDSMAQAAGGFGFLFDGMMHGLVEDMEISGNYTHASAGDASDASSIGGAVAGGNIIRRSRLTGNRVSLGLGGTPPDSSVYGPSGANGGAIATTGPLDLSDSVLMGNSVSLLASGARGGIDEPAAGGGIALDGHYQESRSVSILRTSIVRNDVVTGGEGPVWALGGGIALLHGFDAAVTIVSSTLSENRLVGDDTGGLNVGHGGAISFDDNAGATPRLNVFNTTIANNEIVADDAINAGIFCSGPASAAMVSVTNSILWHNTTYGRLVDDCTGTINGSYNLTSSTWCFPSTEPTNQESDPQLMPLTAVTDTCWVHPIATSSLAHDYGNDGSCLSPAGTNADTDQCGRPRTGSCDIGAAEAQP